MKNMNYPNTNRPDVSPQHIFDVTIVNYRFSLSFKNEI